MNLKQLKTELDNRGFVCVIHAECDNDEYGFEPEKLVINGHYLIDCGSYFDFGSNWKAVRKDDDCVNDVIARIAEIEKQVEIWEKERANSVIIEDFYLFND